ncbi:hypothetical protein NDU88_007917 [Pleurodeles waltl]|uniref:Uncharacterized protein n=1 Tax=Pleurodeles waltl TaxID=8319 RepID=A0AAV7NXV7_PLEWA|nr:hypothetical protein NDU88_007917 [Pleurodeles waltl]
MRKNKPGLKRANGKEHAGSIDALSLHRKKRGPQRPNWGQAAKSMPAPMSGPSGMSPQWADRAKSTPRATVPRDG